MIELMVVIILVPLIGAAASANMGPTSAERCIHDERWEDCDECDISQIEHLTR